MVSGVVIGWRCGKWGLIGWRCGKWGCNRVEMW